MVMMVNIITPNHTRLKRKHIILVGETYIAVGTDSKRPTVIPKKKIEDR
jgi:hypothetical protein